MATTIPPSQLTEAPEAQTPLDLEVEAWFDEAHRLFAEARERVASGRPLAALSSLVAVPPLHSMLIDRCSAILNEGTSEPIEVEEPSRGMYL